MHEITMPKLNNNDVSYVLVEWLADDGEQVKTDLPIAVVETSKAAEELVAEADGVLHHDIGVNTEIAVGAVIGRIFTTEQDRRKHLSAGSKEKSAEASGAEVVITKAASEAAAELGVGLDELHHLGKKVVKRQDVEELAAALAQPSANDQPSDGIWLSRSQRAVGEVVTRSHQSIPAAFAVMKLPVDAALALQSELAVQTQSMVGLPELLIKAIAELRGRFPLFFGSHRDDGSVALVGGCHVGVTLDLGKGLYIPVVRDVENKSLAEVADVLMDFRVSALRGSFRETELAGGNITISLNNDPDIVLARPIIFSGQTCMLCLCATQEEVYRTAEGGFEVRRYANLGLTYDHRVVNGRDATLLLQELKAIFTDMGRLSQLS